MTEDDEKYEKLLVSSSTLDRIIYLFGGTKIFALLAALVGIMVATTSFYTSIRELEIRERTAVVAESSREVLYEVRTDVSKQAVDADTIQKAVSNVRALVSRDKPLGLVDQANLLSSLNDIDRSATRIGNSSKDIEERLKKQLYASGSHKDSLELSLISSAHAQTSANAANERSSQGNFTIETLRPIVMLFVILIITVFFSVCIWLFCSTKDVERLKFADNMIRTIIGFYIGIVTGLLGLPTGR